MKRQIFLVALIAVMVAIAGYNMYQVQNEAQLSDLQLANVEALADWESGGSIPLFLYPCYVHPFGNECTMKSNPNRPSCAQLSYCP